MKLITLLLILCLFTVTAKAQDDKGSNPQEKKVLKLINSLPEVIRANKYMQKKVPGRGLKAYIQSTPDKQTNFYRVSVSEFNGMCLVSHFWFYVNAVNYDIFYDDFENEKRVPLKVWLKHPYGVYSKRGKKF